jgi:hypothetical protein
MDTIYSPRISQTVDHKRDEMVRVITNYYSTKDQD